MGKIVTGAAQVSCDHQAAAQAQSLSSYVSILQSAVVLVPQVYTVQGCPLSTNAGPVPCATIQFSTGTTRVTSQMKPLMLEGSMGTAVGPLSPAQGSASIRNVQGKVTAT
ncbi:hypothetical protein [Actibacterium atlanticum]|uniref:hypothetical protein n=1 Tax=Actibacterium atlanticum TaxID=1461693 RepID=UPI000690BED0|nr:hypothetical protein [Actibacterium atlanticum]